MVFPSVGRTRARWPVVHPRPVSPLPYPDERHYVFEVVRGAGFVQILDHTTHTTIFLDWYPALKPGAEICCPTANVIESMGSALEDEGIHREAIDSMTLVADTLAARAELQGYQPWRA